MITIAIKTENTNHIQEIATKLKLKTQLILTKGYIIFPLKGYSENEFLKINLILKYLIQNKHIQQYHIIPQPYNPLSKQLQSNIETFIKTNILKIPINILYIRDAPICYQTIQFKIPQITEEILTKYKNIGTLATKYPNQILNTKCTLKTKTYTYPTQPSTPILLSMMTNKLNLNLNKIQPNPIQIAKQLKNNQTTINEIHNRKIIIQKTINNKGQPLHTTTIKILTNYTDTLTKQAFKDTYTEILKFITLNDIYKIIGIKEQILSTKDLLQYIQKPHTLTQHFKKIQVKYYKLENNTTLIDAIKLIDKENNLTIITNTHNLTKKQDHLQLSNNGLYYKYHTYQQYYEFLTQNYQKIIARKNKDYLII